MGDDLYWEAAAAAREARGAASPLPPVKRGGGLYLMSTSVSFLHPTTDEAIAVEVELHDKFGRLLEKAARAAERGANAEGGGGAADNAL